MTVLFADLVGFTSRSEAMDVEDVRGTLQPYHQLLRGELERFGGTVEKFIGDAVMALFGAPTAHEDDPERAVRAALSIQHAVARLREDNPGLDLHVRIGVNTGEALVALGARPSEGEGMASGDVVNTAARLQSAAPVDGVLVGEVTYRATDRAIEYDVAEPITAKGKADPVPVWVARQARSRLGTDVRQASSTALVGREQEVRLLWEVFERTRTERTPRLVTLMGVPGIGKSRLVWEFFRRVEDDPDLTTWRHGRSLAYGDGVAFWALGEMVKAQAGILDSDAAEAAAGKLGRAVRDLISNERDSVWVEGHLRPLVGLETAEELSGDRQAEAFAAWRRFFEVLAEQRPTVLVFEDLHWADEALLDFLDHLVEWAAGVPLLVVATTRPELLERRKAFGAGTASTLRVALSPLSEADTARLVAALLEQAVLPAETQSALLERAEGNPLYAEEYVRMLIDRGLLLRNDRGWALRAGEQLPMPETVQGLVAARVDSLALDEKAILQDASVIGKVAWVGAVAHIAGRGRWAVEEHLHRLSQKGFMRPERVTSVEGEAEYAFQHALIRDVVYSGIVRAVRAEKHERAAAWIESLAGDRADRVELLAHHYLAGLDYARLSGQETTTLAERTRLALREAGDHALALNAFAAAATFYAKALDMWPDDAPDRAQVMFGLGKAQFRQQDAHPEALILARDALVACGDVERAAEAETMIGSYSGNIGGDPAEELLHMRRAVELLADAPASWPKGYALASLAAALILDEADYDAGIRLSQDALTIAEQLGLTVITAHAWMWIGIAKLQRGELGGRDDMLRGVALAGETHSPDAIIVYANVAENEGDLGELAGARQLIPEVKHRAETLGSPFWLTIAQSLQVRDWYYSGDWQAATRTADELLDSHTPASARAEPLVRLVRSQLRAVLISPADATSDLEAIVESGRRTGEMQVIIPALALYAANLVACSRLGEAKAVARELLDRWRGELWGQWALGAFAYASHTLGVTEPFQKAAAKAHLKTPWLHAALAITSRDYRDAAAIYHRIEAIPDRAFALLQAGTQLMQQGHQVEGEVELAKSLAFWRRVGATAYVQEGEELLARAETA